MNQKNTEIAAEVGVYFLLCEDIKCDVIFLNLPVFLDVIFFCLLSSESGIRSLIC